MVNVNNLTRGDVLSEESHYVVENISPTTCYLKHVESSTMVTISNDYVARHLDVADQFNEVVEVTRDDKKDGTPGIRTIFANIYTSEVFSVVFTKQETNKTIKQFKEEKDKQIEYACGLIDTAKRNKKSMSEAYKEALQYIQEHPLSRTIPGEKRTLRGYKMQFSSQDGKYKCKDLDIITTDKESGERVVNINTISELIYHGVKYIVK